MHIFRQNQYKQDKNIRASTNFNLIDFQVPINSVNGYE